MGSMISYIIIKIKGKVNDISNSGHIFALADGRLMRKPCRQKRQCASVSTFIMGDQEIRNLVAYEKRRKRRFKHISQRKQKGYRWVRSARS